MNRAREVDSLVGPTVLNRVRLRPLLTAAAAELLHQLAVVVHTEPSAEAHMDVVTHGLPAFTSYSKQEAPSSTGDCGQGRVGPEASAS